MPIKSFKQEPLDNATGEVLSSLANLDQERPLAPFRDDLRPPELTFSRCAITGEFASCVTIDLGDMSINSPDCARGVTLDNPKFNSKGEYIEGSGEVRFSVWKPHIVHQQLTISEDGLRRLLEFSQNSEHPIEGITPDLHYMWSILNSDGSGRKQFEYNPETDEEVEVNTRELGDYSQVSQISLIPRYNSSLPVYTFVSESGKIYKDGQEIDLAFDAPIAEGALPFYARRILHVWGSTVPQGSLSRNLNLGQTSVLQLIGWRVGGVGSGEAPCCIIAIDEQGGWRPWQYLTEEEYLSSQKG